MRNNSKSLRLARTGLRRGIRIRDRLKPGGGMNLGSVLAGGRDEMAGSAGGDGSGRGGRDARDLAGSRPVPETSRTLSD